MYCWKVEKVGKLNVSEGGREKGRVGLLLEMVKSALSRMKINLLRRCLATRDVIFVVVAVCSSNHTARKKDEIFNQIIDFSLSLSHCPSLIVSEALPFASVAHLLLHTFSIINGFDFISLPSPLLNSAKKYNESFFNCRFSRVRLPHVKNSRDSLLQSGT
jgi:hypothetical protein